MFNDNYGYVIVDKERKAAALVDPADPEPVMSALREMSVTPTQLWCTHYHADHQGGNAAFKRRARRRVKSRNYMYRATELRAG